MEGLLAVLPDDWLAWLAAGWATLLALCGVIARIRVILARRPPVDGVPPME